MADDRLKQKQNARLYEVVSQLGFQRSPLDHLMFIKRSSNGIVVSVVYVDGVFLIGDRNQEIAFAK